jgi:uncharacterized protein YdaU (DUF1376 family)
MGKNPAFQFYPNDWLSSAHITLMTPAEEGAYIRLLAYAWSTEDCGLPDDDEELSRLSRLGEDWFKGGSTTVRRCFFKNGDRLYNKRLLEEQKKQILWREKSKQGGIKSGKIRNIDKLIKEGSLNHPSSAPVEPLGNISSSSSSSIKPPIVPHDFDVFWKAYPKKIGKGAALKSWKKNSHPSIEKILVALEIQKGSEQWKKENGQFIPNPATWLNQGRWEDEIISPKLTEDPFEKEYREKYGKPAPK